MRGHAFAAVVVVCFAAPSLAQELPPGRGTFAPNGSVFTTSISPQGDVDDYVFQGFPGMTATATVKALKSDTDGPLLADVSFVRPDGTVPTDDDGFLATTKGGATTATTSIDETGWWKVRVRGAVNPGFGPTTGPYSIKITYTAPPATTLVPAAAKSFTKKGVISSKSDVDDFPFQGFAGQTLSAALTAPKGSALFPSFALFRPDGTSVTTKAFDGKSASVAVTLDQNGTWRLRVAGLEHPDDGDPTKNSNTVGAYTLAVKLGKLKTPPTLLPDASGQYQVRVPGVAGAKLLITVPSGPDAPTPNWFVDPTGHTAAGFPGSFFLDRAFTFPAGSPLGEYTLVLDAARPTAAVSINWSLTLPTPAKKRVAKLSDTEPAIHSRGIDPVAGGAGVVVSVKVDNVVDDGAPGGSIALFLDDVPLENVSLGSDGVTVSGTVPAGLRLGTYDVVVASTSGQVDARADAFEIVAPPTLTSVDPVLGPSIGGFDMTFRGTGFRTGQMALTIDGSLSAATLNVIDAKTLKFTLPPHTPQVVNFRVEDLGSRLTSNMLPFTYVSTPVVNHMTPPMVALIAGETVTLSGLNFNSDDKVFVETTTPGVYENVTATQTTFVDSAHHRFNAPSRPKGQYGVYVEDAQGRPTTKTPLPLTYYSFADATAAAGLNPVTTDAWDGASSALADFDGDGKPDLFLARRGGSTVGGSSQTRVLHNDGAGHFTDVTASVMPAVTATEDWRADRIWLADMDRSQDGKPDLVLVTNDSTVLPANVSHVRILVNEARGGTGANANDRVFRDRTLDLFAPPRTSLPFGSYSSYPIADNWRGLDVWVGDVDKSGGQPEVMITHKETKQETDVSCAPYCASPTADYYTYGFYWGGSREFVWDKQKHGGLGQYKFNRDFFPRKAGLRVPIVVPGGSTLPICNANYNQPCAGKFTPFTGKRIAVGDLDIDANGTSQKGLLDVAVVSDDVVQRIYPPSSTMVTISSLQVAIQRFNPSDGALVTDVTDQLTALGGDFKADCVAIGHTGYPDGNAYGSIAISKAGYVGAGSLRIVKFKPPSVTIPAHFAEFDDVTSATIPSTTASDSWQASQIAFADVDQDADQDLVLVANAAPGGTGPALRVLRNEAIAGTNGVFKTSLVQVLPPVSSTEHFEGDALSIGDVTGDGFLDFVVTRNVTSGSGTQTRIVKTDH